MHACTPARTPARTPAYHLHTCTCPQTYARQTHSIIMHRLHIHMRSFTRANSCMQILLHTCMYTYSHTRILTYPTSTHILHRSYNKIIIHAYILARARSRKQARTPARAPARARKNMPSPMRARSGAHVQTLMHIRIIGRTRKC